MTPRPRNPGNGGDGKPGDGNSGDGNGDNNGAGKPSQSHGSIDASSSVGNAQDATVDIAEHGRPPGTGGKPGDPTTPTPSSSHTQPSGQPDPNATPGGTPSSNDRASSKVKEGLRIENDSATILARAGYKISQNTGEKGRNGTSDPDYNMEGKLWDCYAPTVSNREGVRSELKEKAKKQSGSIVINMERSPMSVDEMKAILPHVKGLEEVKIIDKNGTIIDAFPQ